ARWYSGSCGGTLVGTGSSINVSPTTNTTYFVRFEGSCNTTTCASTTVTVNSLSTAPTSISGTTTICNGNSTTLTLNGGSAGTGGNARWYSGSCGGTLVGIGSSINVSPTTNTTYFVRFEGSCNTTTCASTTVNVNPNPTANAGGALAPICQGGQSAAMGGSVGGGATGGTWTGGAGTWTNANDPANASYTASTTESGNITLTLTTSGGACGTTTVTKTITVNQNSTVNAGGTLAPICQGSTSAAMGGSVGGGATGGTWTGGAGTWTNPNDPANARYTASATESGNITLTLTTSGGVCGTTTATKTITINQNPTVNAGGALTPICQGGQSAAMGGSVGDGATGGTWTGGAGTWTNPNDPANASYTASATESGNITLTLTTSGGSCGTTTATKTLTINPLPTTPTIHSITNPTCSVTTGSISLTGLPSGSWTLYQSGTTTNTIIGSGSTTIINGLAVGSYTFMVNNGNCDSNSSVTATLNNAPIITNTWTGSWDNGTPTLDQKIVFAEDYNEDTNVKGCSCKVTPNKNVIIKTGRIMQIVNDVEVMGTGSLTFENHASLVQINNNAINSGNITYNRTTASILKTDYTYWSSPVENFTLGGIKAGTLYYMFNAAGNSWTRAYASTIMTPGNGYIVRGEGTGFNSGSVVVNAPFFGKPNNGIISTPIVGSNASNLIGNPYPSAIDADAFLYANDTVLEGTLYFWTHGTAIQLASNITNGTAGSGKYAYTSDDYATYNYTGGTSGVNGVIGAGQGFMATGLSGGSATFTNSMRIGPAGELLNNSFFFKPASNSKTAKTATTSKMEKNRVWLNLSNTQGAFKQALIGYITGATNNYDRGYDGISYDGNSFIDFYSINQNNPLTIQGRALPFQDSDVVPLGYSTTIEGEFSITIDKADGFLSEQSIYLEDKVTNTTHNLKMSPYTFKTTKGTFNNRFVLTYKPQNTLGTDTVEELNNTLIISQKDNVIKINASTETILEVRLFDITGKLIFEKTKIEQHDLLITSLTAAEQMLIVKVKLQNGQIINKKLIF
ncbi:T9SS sorting signal type C domain-containing protein, partial [Flavobacterium sp. UMI-01]|uniref:Ig-like domain-containing protein n=1 Tax=Flavobacterium sp. UMI-01 TaxID=1441053 RepID=UPI001C7D5608